MKTERAGSVILASRVGGEPSQSGEAAAIGTGETLAAAASVQATNGAGMSTTNPRAVKPRRGNRVLLARRGRAWDPQEVAEHLMSCRPQMVRGLGRKTPWAGLDDETLDSCFGHGAAVVVRVAESGQRPEWRSARDLEKAQIAAFRHQALDHWKRVNAQFRQGDRLAVAFDPERHAPQDAPMDRLFEHPDPLAIQRDLLAEIVDPELRRFWSAVLGDGASFKTAGDGLGLTKAQVMARTRAGRATFTEYFERRDSGALCRDRGADIVATRSGAADDARVERAEAHLESCYSCALVHEPGSGAIERGILGVAPIGLALRLATRAGEVASVPATRWMEAGVGARLVTAGLAAVAVAGSGAGIDSATEDPPVERASPAPAERRAAPVAREPFLTPARVLAPPVLARARTAAAAPTGAKRAARAKRPAKTAPSRRRAPTATPASRAVAPAPAPPPPVPAPPTQPSGPAVSEFSFERTSPTPASAPPAPQQPSPPEAEFAGP